MKTEDVTRLVSFGDPDGELLPMQYCVCGEKFAYWQEVLHSGSDDPWTCPKCGVKLYFTQSITVYEIKEE